MDIAGVGDIAGRVLGQLPIDIVAPVVRNEHRILITIPVVAVLRYLVKTNDLLHRHSFFTLTVVPKF